MEPSTIREGGKDLEAAPETAAEKLPPTRVLLARGKDIVNGGTKRGRGIVIAGYQGWTEDNSMWLEFVNGLLQNYLLIFPQTAIDAYYQSLIAMSTGVKSNILTAEQFSNAAAVMELQYNSMGNTIPIDHTSGGMGATSFRLIYDGSEIMFLGVLGTEFNRDDNALTKFSPCDKYDRCLKVWDIEWEMINNLETGEGEVWLIGEATAPAFGAQQVRDWSIELHEWADEEREHAEKTGGTDEAEDVASLYYVSNCLPDPEESLLGFDPFKIDTRGLPTARRQKPDELTLIPHLERVIAYGKERDEYFLETEMGQYLVRLLERLAQKRHALRHGDDAPAACNLKQGFCKACIS